MLVFSLSMWYADSPPDPRICQETWVRLNGSKSIYHWVGKIGWRQHCHYRCWEYTLKGSLWKDWLHLYWRNSFVGSYSPIVKLPEVLATIKLLNKTIFNLIFSNELWKLIILTSVHTNHLEAKHRGTMTHRLTQISVNDWPQLRDKFLADWPTHSLGYYTVDNFIKWKSQDPSYNDVTFYSLDDDWSDGTVLIIVRCFSVGLTFFF